MAGAAAVTSQPQLHRGIGVVAATGSGVAVIVGAGVFVLLGEAAGDAGNAVWLSFVLSGAVAFFTALSYAELSSMLPRAAAGYTYTREAFGEGVGFVVGWLMLFSQVVAVSAVALGFGAYADDQVGVPKVGAALALAWVAAVIAYRGVRESTRVGAALALLEAGGLVVIIAAGIAYFGDVDYLERPKGMSGVFSGASLLFFAFLGFEQVANLAQEVKRPGRDLPVAILASGAIAAALYVLVALAAVSVIGWQALSESGAPLAAVARVPLGDAGADALSAIALVATASTVLIGLVAAARTLYGMAAAGAMPALFSAVHARRGTPWTATAAVAAAAVAGILSRDIGLVAEMTNFTILLAFIAVNLALVALRRKRPSEPRPFRVPGSMLGVPVAPLLGVATSALLMANVSGRAALFSLIIVAAAVAAYAVKTRAAARKRGAVERTTV